MTRKTQAKGTVPTLPEAPFDPEPVPGVVQSKPFGVPLGDVPLEEIRQGLYYLNRKVEVRLRDQHHQVTMRRLWLGLDRVGARLVNGQRVANNADAIRWLLEQIDEG